MYNFLVISILSYLNYTIMHNWIYSKILESCMYRARELWLLDIKGSRRFQFLLAVYK